MDVDLLQLILDRIISPGLEQRDEEGIIRYKRLVQVEREEQIVVLGVHHFGGRPYDEVHRKRVRLRGVDVGDLRTHIVQRHAQIQVPGGDTIQETNVHAERGADPFALLLARAYIGQIASDDLHPNSRGDILRDGSGVRSGHGEIVTGEAPEYVREFIRTDLLSQRQKGEIDPDVPPTCDGLGVPHELVPHVVRQAGQPFRMRKAQIPARLAGQRRRIVVRRGRVVRDRDGGLSHTRGPSARFDQQEKHRGPALRCGSDVRRKGQNECSRNPKADDPFHAYVPP